MNIEQIARIAHEANRAYCQSIGDDSQPTWENAPQWQRDSALNGVQFHLKAPATCQNQLLGSKPSASASHDSWLEEKRAAGWKYGPIKDPEKKEHPCFVPYGELPLEQRMKDYLFAAVVAAFAEHSQGEQITA